MKGNIKTATITGQQEQGVHGPPAARRLAMSMALLIAVCFISLGEPMLAYAADATSLDIAAPVSEAGSDQTAIDFQENYLPTMNDLLTQDGETVSLDNLTLVSIDPSALTLATDSDVRVYFVGETSADANTLGYDVALTTTDATTTDSQIIFPDVTANPSYANTDDLSNASTNKNYPLLPGDFVDLGAIEGGSELDFFIIADGASGGTDIYSTDTSVNADSLVNVATYAVADSPYLLVVFEDADGGQLVFAVDIGAENLSALTGGSAEVSAMTTAPEPSMLLMLGSFLLLTAYLRKRQRNAASRLSHA